MKRISCTIKSRGRMASKGALGRKAGGEAERKRERGAEGESGEGKGASERGIERGREMDCAIREHAARTSMPSAFAALGSWYIWTPSTTTSRENWKWRFQNGLFRMVRLCTRTCCEPMMCIQRGRS